jgi:hypothetical protein
MRPDPDPVSGIVWTNVYIVLTFKTIVMSGKTCIVWSREERATTPAQEWNPAQLHLKYL